MKRTHSLNSFSDDELLRRLSDLLGQSRRVEADLVAHIGEVDARRLYAREAAPSMFGYCTERLHLSEAEAYLRIAAARAAREHPALLDMLADGRLHLSGVAKLAPHLTAQNRETLLRRAEHKSKRQIEELVAEWAPRPDVPSFLRKLPARRPGMPTGPVLLIAGAGATAGASRRTDEPGSGAVASPLVLPEDGASSPRLQDQPALSLELRPDAVGVPTSHAPSSRIEPLSPARYKVQFTASAELHDKLERLRALMRSAVPDGDLARIVEQAVTEKLERLEARRFGKTQAPRKAVSLDATVPAATRNVPAAVRRAVYARDGGRCGFVDEWGRRCTARDHLDFHHRHPFGHGGNHSPENLGLRCRTHNLHLAEHDYGEAISVHRRPQLPVHGPGAAPPG